MRLIPGNGVMVDGHGHPKAAVRAAAAEYLIAAHDWPAMQADDACDEAPVARAWWGGEEVGFVGEDHPDATPVTVVNVQVPA